MYRLLIIDDEPFIVDGLFALLNNLEEIELDVYKAYSGKQAIEWLERIKFDIVLTDIRMPKIDGFQILDEVKKYWPQCRIIFLSGYNDFDYIYKATQNQNVKYLLKSEGEKKIICELKKVIEEIQKDIDIQEILSKMKRYYESALPLLREKFLLSILLGEECDQLSLPEQFKEYGIEFVADTSFLLITARITNWIGNIALTGKIRMNYQIESICRTIFSPKAKILYISYEDTKFVLLVQPYTAIPQEYYDTFGILLQYTRNALESIQDKCHDLLNISISFAMQLENITWSNVSKKHIKLDNALSNRFGLSQDIMILNHDEMEKSEKNHCEDRLLSIHLKSQIMESLRSCLYSGQKEIFMKKMEYLLSHFEHPNNSNYFMKLETYFSLVNMFVSYINQRGLTDFLNMDFDWAGVALIEQSSDLCTMKRHFYSLAEQIFTFQSNRSSSREKEVINSIETYILTNIDKDVSLTCLGELVNLNTSYLSRFYKKYKGYNLSDYIKEVKIKKAKEMLKDHHTKIKDIALKTGFSSSSYFSQVFKEITDMTPEEYRIVTIA